MLFPCLAFACRACIPAHVFTRVGVPCSTQAEELLSLDEENRKMFEAVRGNDALQVCANVCSCARMFEFEMYICVLGIVLVCFVFVQARFVRYSGHMLVPLMCFVLCECVCVKIMCGMSLHAT
jgi:hypothetical protein